MIWNPLFTGIAYAILTGGFATAIGAMIATIVNSPVEAAHSASATADDVTPPGVVGHSNQGQSNG